MLEWDGECDVLYHLGEEVTHSCKGGSSYMYRHVLKS